MARVATPPTARPATTPQVTVPQEKVRQRAYEKWVKRGRPQGSDLQDWYEAEAELRAEYARAAAATAGRR